MTQVVRGINKSGDYLTSIVNTVANILLKILVNIKRHLHSFEKLGIYYSDDSVEPRDEDLDSAIKIYRELGITVKEPNEQTWVEFLGSKGGGDEVQFRTRDGKYFYMDTDKFHDIAKKRGKTHRIQFSDEQRDFFSKNWGNETTGFAPAAKKVTPLVTEPESLPPQPAPLAVVPAAAIPPALVVVKP